MKRILAIDPGSTESGYLFFQPGHKMLLNGFGKVSNESVLEIIRTKGEHYDLIVIEMLSGYVHFKPGSNQSTIGSEILKTAIWIGRFIQHAESVSKETVLMPRKAVSANLCPGNPAPRDCHVRAALIKRFGEPGTMKNPGPLYGVVEDIWSSLALAASYVDKNVIQDASIPPNFQPGFL